MGYSIEAFLESVDRFPRVDLIHRPPYEKSLKVQEE